MKARFPKHTFKILSAFLALAVSGLLLSDALTADNAPAKAEPSPLPTIITPELPYNFDFAGEVVPTDDPIVKEQLEAELIQNTHAKMATILYLKRANRWRDTMTAILRKNDIPEDFFYLMVAESGVRNVKSPMGAHGYWQFMPATGKEYGLRQNSYVDMRKHPIKATHAACKYLKRAYKKFGNWTIVAASYNMGMGGVNSSMSYQRTNNYHDLFLNIETGRYVYRILAIKAIMENPSRYGFYLSDRDLYSQIPTKTVKISGTTNLVSFAKKHGVSYKSVRFLNPWIKKSKIYGTYEVQIPV